VRRVVGFGLPGFMALVVAGVSVSLASTQESAPLLPDVIEEVPSQWVKFWVVRKGANASITILDHSPCVPEVLCGFRGNP